MFQNRKLSVHLFPWVCPRRNSAGSKIEANRRDGKQDALWPCPVNGILRTAVLGSERTGWRQNRSWRKMREPKSRDGCDPNWRFLAFLARSYLTPRWLPAKTMRQPGQALAHSLG